MKFWSGRLSDVRGGQRATACDAETSIATPTKRTAGDAVKLMAAFCIVVAHTTTPHPVAAVGYTAIALFIAMYAQRVCEPYCGGAAKISGAFHLKLRLRRLLLPWLTWCAVYKAVDAYRARSLGTLFAFDDPLSLLTGPSVHLWFLPFIGLVTLAVGLSAPRLRSRRAVIVGWVLAAPVTWLSFYAHDHSALPVPFAQWSFGLPAAIYGVLVAASRRVDLRVEPWAMLGFLATASLVPGPTQWLLFYAAALLIFEWCLITSVSVPVPLGLRRLAFTMYLVHPLALLIWYKFAGSDSTPLITVTAVAAITLVLGWGIRQLPIARGLV